jgi:carbonic anhydrase/acetyltransferase-like protein (isoleucine patch superfamily)
MILSYSGKIPIIHETVFIAEGAHVIGDVEIGAESSIWFNSVIRGDVNSIRIGARSNVQDNTVIHVTDKKFPTFIASNVTIGHAAIIHGCKIEDYCLIGMGAILLDNCNIGDHSLVAAGTLVREGFVVPSGTLVAGVPAKIIRELSEEELKRLEDSAEHYVALAERYKAESRHAVKK